MKGRNEAKRGNYDCSTLHKPDCGKKKNKKKTFVLILLCQPLNGAKKEKQMQQQ